MRELLQLLRVNLVGPALVVLALAAAGTPINSAAEETPPKPSAKPRAKPPAVRQVPDLAPPNSEVPAAVSAPSLAPPPASAATPLPAPAAAPEPVTFAPSTPEELAVGYPLGVGDVVRVFVFQQPDMTVETRVSETGTITVPLLGAVPVSGVTARRVEGRIASLLRSRGFVRDPQVIVTVLQFKSRQVSVLGLVSRPGRYALEEGVYRLTDVLALAGGAIIDAADTVTLVRMVSGKSARYEIDLPALFRSGDFSNNPEILAGDSIYVARAPQFYIYGEVNRPGTYRLDKDMTLMQGLAMGGGITLRGSQKSIQIRRRGADGQYATFNGALGDPIHRDDVIFVRESMF